MKVLVVDDEPLARERLADLVVELYPNARLAMANEGVQALHEIDSFAPDIVLLDIRMPRMDGLEVAQHLLTLSLAPALVFTTAYQDHAINAFDTNAVDYLLKPIRKERLQTAIERAELINRSKLMSIIEEDEVVNRRTHVSSVIRDRMEILPVEQIVYLKADQKYVSAAWPDGELLLDESLVSLETEFADVFIRIHRNALVAKSQICGLEKSDDGQSLVKLRDMPTRLTVSRRHLSHIKHILRELTSR